MATGMRLCSPSSHDGSLSWLEQFMTEIDKRGWRCDILDMHCYWPEWNLNNALKGYYDKYKRPIWVSEFVWELRGTTTESSPQTVRSQPRTNRKTTT